MYRLVVNRFMSMLGVSFDIPTSTFVIDGSIRIPYTEFPIVKYDFDDDEFYIEVDDVDEYRYFVDSVVSFIYEEKKTFDLIRYEYWLTLVKISFGLL